MQALVGQLVRIVLVDECEIVGTLIWYVDGKFGIKNDSTHIMSCNRLASIVPIEVDEEAVPFLVDNLKTHLLNMEERSSRIQGVKRRIRERNNRVAAASKYAANR